MIKLKKVIASVASGTIALCAASGAYADHISVTQPGETVGIALGAPLPEGVYFVSTGSMGGYRGDDDHLAALGVNIPVIAWSTPWTFLDGRIEAYAAVPEISAGVPSNYAGGALTTPYPGVGVAGRDFIAMYNPALLIGEAWDLGKVLSPALEGWGFSNFVGGYAPVDNELRIFGHNVWVFNERAALSYTGDHWNLTAHMIYGIVGDDVDTGVKVRPDYVNLDLTAVKTLGKWQVGPVAFGSWAASGCSTGETTGIAQGSVINTCGREAQFAVGGLIGYDFPGITTQLFFTKDVYSEGYYNTDGSKSYESRLWLRVIVPLWTPPAEASLK